MKKCWSFLFLIIVLSMAGCAKKLMTPEEIAAERDRQLKMITRVYDDKTPQEVLLAADRVFRLADDDYEVSHNPNGLTAKRNWMIYLIISATMGTDTWVVTAEALPTGGTKATAMHISQASSVIAGPVPTSGGGVSATSVTTPGIQGMTTQPAIYELFFARLDHLLGKRKDWVTCKNANDALGNPKGFFDPFCTVANDRTPDGKSAAQRREQKEKEEATNNGALVN